MEAYHLTLGRLFKWMLLAIKTRKEDIVRRKALKKKAKEERENLIQQAEALKLKKAQDLIDAEEKFKEDHRDEIEAASRTDIPE